MSTPNYNALAASDGVGEAVRATVQSPGRSIGSTSIPVNATTNWPTGTFIATTGTLLSTGKLDPTTVQVFYGTASGTTITITSFAAGYTDLGNVTNDVVVLKPTTEGQNIVATGLQSTTQFPSQFANFVEPAGGVWTTSSGLVGSMTAGNVWYNGVRSAMAAVSSHTFTASKDTYVDYNPSAATWTYVEETNGAAEPAVTSGCVRVAKIVTGASAITSITQGQYNYPISGLSTIFSGQLTSFTPNGTYTSGGNYINLGGIKICFGWSSYTFSASSSTAFVGVTFPITYSSPPVVVAVFGGDETSGTPTLGGGSNGIQGAVSSKATAITTTAFFNYCYGVTGGWVSGNTVYWQWVAIGT